MENSPFDALAEKLKALLGTATEDVSFDTQVAVAEKTQQWLIIFAVLIFCLFVIYKKI